jgi:hypothetical protein
MGIKKFILNPAWSFIGVLLTIILSLTPFFLQEKSNISYSLLENTNIIEVAQPIPALEIQYKGVKVTQKDLSIRSIKVRVENSGSKSILQSEFDEKLSWGIQFPNFEIIDYPKITNASSDYIKDNLKPEVQNKNTLNFSKIILDKNSFFEIETTIISSKNSQVSLDILGKIAGLPKTPNVFYIADQHGTSPGKIDANTPISFPSALNTLSLVLTLCGGLAVCVYRFNKRLPLSSAHFIDGMLGTATIVPSFYMIYMLVFSRLGKELDSQFTIYLMFGIISMMFFSVNLCIGSLTAHK